MKKPDVRSDNVEAAPIASSRLLGIFEGQGEEIDPDWWRPMTDAEVEEWLGDRVVERAADQA